MRDYSWGARDAFEKATRVLLAALSLAVGVLIVAIPKHDIMAQAEWASFAWSKVCGSWKYAFVLVFVGVMWAIERKNSRSLEHQFFTDRACINTRLGRRVDIVRFSASDVLSIRAVPDHFGDQPIYLIMFRLKPKLNYLGRERLVTVGTPAQLGNDLRALRDWSQSNRLDFQIETPVPDQRRS